MPMKSQIGFQFWILFCAEVLMISIFWPGVILLGISLTGLIERPLSLYIFVPFAVVTGIGWLLFRFKGFKKGKYYLNQL